MYQSILNALSHFIQQPMHARDNMGICSKVVCGSKAHQDFKFAMALWPEHSGKADFPIEVDDVNVPCSPAGASLAKTQYYVNRAGADNAYTQARQRLAIHVHDVLSARQDALNKKE